MNPKMQITTAAFLEMISTVGSTIPEKGGLLFGYREDFVIRKFLFDSNAKTSRTSYEFDIAFLNPIIKKWWEEDKLELLGFFHSHPNGCRELSHADKHYFQSQFANIPVDQFLVPLCFSAKDSGAFEFLPYIVHKNGNVESVKLELVPDYYQSDISQKKEALEEPIITQTIAPRQEPKQKQVPFWILLLQQFPFNKAYHFLLVAFLGAVLGFFTLLLPLGYLKIIELLHIAV